MTAEIIALEEPRARARLASKRAALFLPDKRTAGGFFRFFTARIRNLQHAATIAREWHAGFSEWCEGEELKDLARGEIERYRLYETLPPIRMDRSA